MTKAKSCPPGKYWCFDDKKCKKIPLGYHIGLRGYLYPDEDGKSNNGNGNSNGHSGNGNGGNGNGGGGGVSEMKENFKRINANGQTYAVMLTFRGRTYNIQMFIPKQTRPTRLEVEKEVNKIYPGSVVRYFEPRVWDPASPALVMPEQMQPGAKDLVQQSDYMKPALQQKKNQTNHKKKKHTCGEGVTLKKVSEVFEIDKAAHKSAQKKAKLRNLAKGNTNPNEKAAAEKKAGGPKLYGEDTVRVEGKLGYVEFIDLIKPEPMKGISERSLTKGEEDKKEDIVKGMKKSFKGFRDRYGDEAKSVMYATATKLAKEELAPHIKKGVAAAKPIIKANINQTAYMPSRELAMNAKKEKPKPSEKNGKSVFKQLTNKDEID